MEETDMKTVCVEQQTTAPAVYENHGVNVENPYDDFSTKQHASEYSSLERENNTQGACRSAACAWLGVAAAFVLGAVVGILLGFFAIGLQTPTGQREVEYYTTDTMVGSARTNYFTSTLTPFNYQTPSVSTANITVQAGQCAFSAVNANLGLAGADDPLVFSEEYVDYPSNTSLDHHRGLFTPVSENRYTLYFYNLDVFTTTRTINVTVRPDPEHPDNWSNEYYTWGLQHSGNADGEYFQIGRETIRGGQANIKMGIFFSGGTLQDSFNAFNGWSGFSLSTAVQPFAIFNMVRRIGESDLGKIGFHRALANAGDNLPVTADMKPGEITNEYPVPFDGLYYFSYSFGTAPNKGAEVVLYVNEQPYSSLVNHVTNRNGSTVVSRSQMLHLYRGNKVSIRLMSGEVHSSPDGQEISLLGFWYRPQSGIHQAWCVHRTSPVETNLSNLLPTSYNRVWVNAGRVWDEKTHKARIKVSGVYYIQTNACKTPRKPLYVHIKVNGRTVASAHTNDNVVQLNAVHSITRGLVIKLDRNDEVYVVTRGTSHSQTYPLTSFTGFLIYPEP